MVRILVSDGADARAFRHESPKVVSALVGMVINSAEMVINSAEMVTNSAEMVTRLTKVIWSIAKTIGVLRCGYPRTQYGQQKTAHSHRQAAHCHRQAAHRHRQAAHRHRQTAHSHQQATHSHRGATLRHPLGCEELWGNREEDEGMGVAYCGAWKRKKRVDIAGWLCLHAFIIDHADGGMLFTSLLHPSRCKPTCSTRHHERSRHQRR